MVTRKTQDFFHLLRCILEIVAYVRMTCKWKLTKWILWHLYSYNVAVVQPVWSVHHATSRFHHTSTSAKTRWKAGRSGCQKLVLLGQSVASSSCWGSCERLKENIFSMATEEDVQRSKDGSDTDQRKGKRQGEYDHTCRHVFLKIEWSALFNMLYFKMRKSWNNGMYLVIFLDMNPRSVRTSCRSDIGQVML